MTEIYTMISRMENQAKMLDVVSHNMANVNTVGFKKQSLSFQSVLDNSQNKADVQSSFATVQSENTDFSAGTIKITNSNLDLSINGDSFFAFQRGEGIVYSKDGHFQVNSTGQLINSSEEKVLGIDNQPIDIPVGTQVRVTPQGEVKSTDGALFGQIGLFKFNDKSTLVQAGNSSFATPNTPEQDTESLLITGALEQSNVDAIQESVNLTKVSRAYESAAKLVKTFEELETKSIRELSKVQ